MSERKWKMDERGRATYTSRATPTANKNVHFCGDAIEKGRIVCDTTPCPTCVLATPTPDAGEREAIASVLNKFSWCVKVNPADNPEDATFEYPLTGAEIDVIKRVLLAR